MGFVDSIRAIISPSSGVRGLCNLAISSATVYTVSHKSVNSVESL